MWMFKTAEQLFQKAQDYEYGSGGVDKDEKKAFEFYLKAADKGHAQAQNEIGYSFQHGIGVAVNPEKAFHYYSLSAAQGLAAAKTSLGGCYENGMGCTQSYAKAFELYLQAAQQGYALAQNNTGYCYLHGIGVTQDYTKAKEFLLLAAQQQYEVAQRSLGYMYLTGLGGAKNMKQAQQYLSAAATTGDTLAKGLCSEYGINTAKNDVQAFSLYLQRAQQKPPAFVVSTLALYLVGRCFANGIGTSVNIEKAKEYWTQAAALHNYEAKKALETLTKQSPFSHYSISTDSPPQQEQPTLQPQQQPSSPQPTQSSPQVPTIIELLTSLSLQQYVEVFAKEAIDLEILKEMNENDLTGIGLPLGHRKKIIKKLEEMKGKKTGEITGSPSMNNDRNKTFFLKNIAVGRELGKGHFGKVYEAIWNGNKVAAKQVNSQQLDEFLQEATILDLDHKNVVRCLGLYCETEQSSNNNNTTGKKWFVITEFMSKGDLQAYLSDNINGIPLSALIQLMMDVALGMEYLSNSGIIHRDLAARNILVSENGVAKVTDFGLSRQQDNSGYYKGTENSIVPFKWTAPEAIQHKKFSPASDVWSFGVTMYEIVTFGAEPYPGMDNANAVEKVLAGYRLPKPPACPLPLYHVGTLTRKSDPLSLTCMVVAVLPIKIPTAVFC